MKKALIVTTVSGFVPQFEMNNVRLLESMGYEVHYATNYKMPVYTDNNDRLKGTGIVCHQVDFVRSPFQIGKNLKAFGQLDKIMEKGSFDLVHCHTPMGGALARLVANKTGTMPVIYTAHGFHFYKGASALNWLLYYPVEKFLARYTDVLITINKEDYKRAKRFSLRRDGSVQYIPGVGVDMKNRHPNKESRDNIRKKWGIKEEDFLLISVGELNKGKNHRIILEAMGLLIHKYPFIKYIICGVGKEEKRLMELAKQLEIDSNVILAGYQNNISDILDASDCFVFPSLREGLSVALMEAMASGLPVICSKIRGNVDLIKEGVGGYFIADHRKESYASKIEVLVLDKGQQVRMGDWNRKRIRQFGEERVRNIMGKVYGRYI